MYAKPVGKHLDNKVHYIFIVGVIYQILWKIDFHVISVTKGITLYIYICIYILILFLFIDINLFICISLYNVYSLYVYVRTHTFIVYIVNIYKYWLKYII